MRMPGMDGVATLERIRAIAPDTVRIMLTGNADQQTAIEAVNRGQVFTFLNKPCPPDLLGPALENALKQAELIRVERELLEGTLTGSVRVLSEVLGMVLPEALSHGQRLRQAMRTFATAAQATPLWELEIAALLSPLGLASVPPDTLRKLEARMDVTLEERAIVERVPQVGHDLLAGIPRLEGAARIILFQQKNFDGSGFPAEICAGNDIPIGARMLKILLDRIALEGLPGGHSRAHETMKARAGAYDPKLLGLSFLCLPNAIRGEVSAGNPVLRLKMDELAPGQIIAADIRSTGGMLVVSAGHQLTSAMINRLGNLSEIGEISGPFMVQSGRGAVT
jgi:response regulator RpfG family c-di-GMP phosphodiesterase